jgi:regulator of sigma E protease
MSLEWIYLYALPFLVVLTIVVFIHELGHFLVARWNGVKVDVFSIGFGPELFGFNDKHETRWKISLLPLGGYVKMHSDLNVASQTDFAKAAHMTEAEKAISLVHKTVWQRMAVSAAGPIANFLYAIVVLALLYMTVGQRMPAEEAKIGTVEQDGPADVAGLKRNDVVISVEDKPVKTFEEMARIFMVSPGKELYVRANRGGETLNFVVTPKPIETLDANGKTVEIGRVGVLAGVMEVRRGFFESWWYAVRDTFGVISNSLGAIGQIIVGEKSAEGLSGPLGIAKFTGDVATGDIATFIWFTAFISISLGLINILPIPVLDGGHLLFYFIEAIRGKPLSEKAQEVGFTAGFLIVMSLMIFATWNDLQRFKVFDWITQLFQ